jgi:hypothetical protein
MIAMFLVSSPNPACEPVDRTQRANRYFTHAGVNGHNKADTLFGEVDVIAFALAHEPSVRDKPFHDVIRAFSQALWTQSPLSDDV